MDPATPFPYRRVLFYGVTGSGKSTAATRFATTANLPLHLVDDLTWLPGWVQVADDEQRRIIGEICDGESWVIDTAYGKWLEIPLARVELVVGLDYPRCRSLGRLLARSWRRAVDKTLICNGNTETFGRLVSTDSIVAWHFRSFKRKRARMRAWAADPQGPDVLLFTRPADLETWLSTTSSKPQGREDRLRSP